jgi:transposase
MWLYDRFMNDESDGRARVVEANRAQLRLVPMDLESLLAEDHQARAVWAFVERLDLGEFYERIGSREGGVGRPAIDPQILLALWIYATLDGVGSARRIERLSREHLAYQWICGGVNVNHHSLSDFRGEAVDLLNGLLTQSVTLLMSQGLVEMRRVAQDGMRVRASAGSSSFRSRRGLEKLQKIAREQVEILAREIEADPGAGSQREEAARKRAREDRVRRIERALEEMAEAEKRKRSNNGQKKTEARTSTTDPGARVMKMGDGGFRPAYNVHFVTDTATKVVVAVAVDNLGTDKHAMAPLAEQLEERLGVRPAEWLADGGCASLPNVEAMAGRQCAVIAPLRQRRGSTRPPTDPVPTDSEAIREWRKRMSTDEGKKIYQERGSTAELVNARCRAQGLGQFLVRGLRKVLAVAVLHAITNNMRCGWALA